MSPLLVLVVKLLMICDAELDSSHASSYIKMKDAGHPALRSCVIPCANLAGRVGGRLSCVVKYPSSKSRRV